MSTRHTRDPQETRSPWPRITLIVYGMRVVSPVPQDACGGNLVDGLDFSEFQRVGGLVVVICTFALHCSVWEVLEILREREGFTREAGATRAWHIFKSIMTCR